MKRFKGQKFLEELWMAEFISKDERGIGNCGLCANTGTIDTAQLERKMANGMIVEPIKVFCICPNGRAKKQISEKNQKS